MKSKKGVVPRHWTEQEKETLREFYPAEGPAGLCRRLGGVRSRGAIIIKALALGISFNDPKRYSEEERQFLREHFPAKGCRFVASALGRTFHSVSTQAVQLGVARQKQSGSHQSLLFRGYGEISSSCWGKIRKAALKRQLTFEISIEHGWTLFLEQERRCKLSCLPLCFPRATVTFDGTASLDRIDSTKGYIEGNVQWVHKAINRMKWDCNDTDFIRYCNAVAKCHPVDVDSAMESNTTDSAKAIGMIKWTPEVLIALYKRLSIQLGRAMSRNEWIQHPETPTDGPVRDRFGRWNEFVIVCGYASDKLYLTERARRRQQERAIPVVQS